MKSLEIVSALYNEQTGFIEVLKRIINDDDSVEYAGHSFHPETTEWIAAVYETNDLDEVIDLILYEPHVENVSPLEMTALEARTVHKSRIEKFKTEKSTEKSSRAKARSDLSEINETFAKAADEEPIEVIKRACDFDSSVIAEKKKQIDRTRQNRKPPTEKTRLTAEQRIERIQLNNHKGARPQPQETKQKVKKPILLEKGKRVKE